MIVSPPRSHPTEPGATPSVSGALSCRLGLAIIGCGGRGADNARALEFARNVRLVQVMDTNAGTARRVGEAHAAAWTTDYPDVLANPAVDIVFLNTPHHLHAEQAILAARAGKHVIVEKPLAINLDDAVRMVHESRECGVQLSVWLGYRYTPAVSKARELIDAGLLGKVLGGHLSFQNYKPPAYFQGADWRARWETCGGGVFIMTGIHYLDWLLYLGKERVREVSAHYATLASPSDVEDSIVMWLQLENGALVSANVSSCMPGGLVQSVDLRLWGSDGALSLSPPYQFYATRALGGKRPERWNSFDPLPKCRQNDLRVHISTEYVDRFAFAVSSGTPLEITAEDGLNLQAIVEAAYRSSRENRPVEVDYSRW